MPKKTSHPERSTRELLGSPRALWDGCIVVRAHCATTTFFDSHEVTLTKDRAHNVLKMCLIVLEINIIVLKVCWILPKIS